MAIFIDESGTLGDPKDQFVVFAGVLTDNPQSLIKIIPKARRRVPSKKKRKRERLVSEFKFRSVGDKTKERILKEIVKSKAKLFVLVLDKGGRKIADTPKNYAFLVYLLLKIVSKKAILKKVFVDRHYNQIDKQEILTKELLRFYRKKITVVHVDSLIDARVDLADFVAGAMLKSVRDKIQTFENLIKPNITGLKIFKWSEIKKEVVDFKPDRRNLPS